MTTLRIIPLLSLEWHVQGTRVLFKPLPEMNMFFIREYIIFNCDFSLRVQITAAETRKEHSRIKHTFLIITQIKR